MIMILGTASVLNFLAISPEYKLLRIKYICSRASESRNREVTTRANCSLVLFSTFCPMTGKKDKPNNKQSMSPFRKINISSSYGFRCVAGFRGNCRQTFCRIVGDNAQSWDVKRIKLTHQVHGLSVGQSAGLASVERDERPAGVVEVTILGRNDEFLIASKCLSRRSEAYIVFVRGTSHLLFKMRNPGPHLLNSHNFRAPDTLSQRKKRCKHFFFIDLPTSSGLY